MTIITHSLKAEKPRKTVANPLNLNLAAKTKAFDNLLVTLFAVSLEVIKQLTSASYEAEKTAAAGNVLFVASKVIGDVNDTLGKKCYLVVCTTGVTFVKLVVCWINIGFAHFEFTCSGPAFMARPPCVGTRKKITTTPNCKGFLTRYSPCATCYGS